MSKSDDPREVIAERPMTGFQFGIIAVLFCLNGLDGFDVLAISFAAPGIVREWGGGKQPCHQHWRPEIH